LYYHNIYKSFSITIKTGICDPLCLKETTYMVVGTGTPLSAPRLPPNEAGTLVAHLDV